MSEMVFSLDLDAPVDDLMRTITDYENISKFLPDQLKNIEVIQKENNKTVTRETIFFSTLIKKPFEQESIHEIIEPNKIETTISSGPAKGSKINLILEKNETGTNVSVKINLKLSLKAIFLQPIIKKWYKRILTSSLYKMNNLINNNQ